MTTSRALTFVLMATLTGAAACSRSAPPPPPAGGGKTVDAATAGSVSGRVVFTGTPPAPVAIQMGIDKACTEGVGPNRQSDAVLVAADGAVQNVFVYVKSGLDAAYSFDVPASPVILDQKGCTYTPRVLGIRAGQPLEVRNSDATLHNVHALPMSNQDFNHGLAFKDTKLTQTFTVPEVMVRFKCDVHPWMFSFVGVVAHPFYAVTNASGAFEIQGLPPGTYVIEAWHEKFGRKTATVKIDPKGTQTVTFAYAPVTPAP
jgi:plastocyanin